MASPNDENQALLHPVLTGRLGAQNTLLNLAQQFDKSGPVEETSYVNSAFAITDNVSNAYSLIKYGYDVLHPEGNADLMHEFMLTPSGIAIIIAETLFLVGFSLLASVFEKEKEYPCFFKKCTKSNAPDKKERFKNATYVLTDTHFYYYPPDEPSNKDYTPIEISVDPEQLHFIASLTVPTDGLLTEEQLEAIRLRTNHRHARSYKKAIADAWPYVRDVLKALKNAYKGWRSLIQALKIMGAFDFLNAIDLKNTILYGGIALGLVATVNRMLLRNMVEKRKVMMGQNAKLLTTFKKLTSLTAEDYDNYLNQIQYQSLESRCLSYLGVGLGGFIDGLYLYAGALSVVALAQPWFIALAVLCAIYTVACIVSRIYEEYDYQLRLEIAQTKCKLALLGKRLETIYCEIESLRALPQTSEKLLKTKYAELNDLLGHFDTTRQLLESQLTRNYLSAALLGIKNGLYAYSALSSLTFFISSILLVTSTAFPPALLISAVILGFVLIGVFLAHSLLVTYRHNQQREEKATFARPYHDLAWLKLYPDNPGIDRNKFQTALQDGFTIDSSPVFFYQEWAEIIRSFFSGASKGQKFIDFSVNYGQEKDENGHYHDTPLMLLLGGFSAVVFSLVLAARALTKGFGRLSIGCGLLKIEGKAPSTLTIEELEPLLKERCAVILYSDNTMIYADLKNGKIKHIPSDSNQESFEKLALRINDIYKLADEEECDLIESLTGQKTQPENDLSGAAGSVLKDYQPRFFNTPKTPYPKAEELSNTIPDSTLDHCTF